jgi:hypothetical protein
MAIEETKVLLQHFLLVNPIFVVICGHVAAAKLSFEDFVDVVYQFMFFKSTKWKHAQSNCLKSINLVPRVFLRTARGEGKTLVSAGHVSPRFWVIN